MPGIRYRESPPSVQETQGHYPERTVALPLSPTGSRPANFPIEALFFLAWAGIPLLMILKRPDRRPDSADARAYLHAKAKLNRPMDPARQTARPARRAA